MTDASFDDYWFDRSIQIIRIGLILALVSSVAFRPFDTYYLPKTSEYAFWMRALVMAPGCGLMLVLTFSRWNRQIFHGLGLLCLAINGGISYLYVLEGNSGIASVFLMITLQSFVFLFVLFRVPFRIASVYGLGILLLFVLAHLLIEQSFAQAMLSTLGATIAGTMLAGFCWTTQREALRLHQTLVELDKTQSSLLTEKESKIKSLQDITRYLGHEIRSFVGVAQVTIPVADTDHGKQVLKRSVDGIDEVLRSASNAASLGDVLASEKFQMTVDLSALIEELVSRFEDADIQLELDDTITLESNPTRLTQAVNALVENAVTFAEPNTSVTVRAHEREDFVCIEVANRGPKPPIGEHQLFEPLRTSRALEIEPPHGSRPVRCPHYSGFPRG